MSVVPPAANGTTSLTGRAGHCSARALRGNKPSAAPPIRTERRFGRDRKSDDRIGNVRLSRQDADRRIARTAAPVLAIRVRAAHLTGLSMISGQTLRVCPEENRSPLFRIMR
jgi:hypothetical protein